MIAHCPYCNSIWVCWNWINAWGGDFEKYVEMNPHMTREELKKTQWGHECWDCDNCHETESKITNGVPYWFLTRFYSLFHRSK